MSELRVNRIIPRDGLPVGASGGGIIQVVQSVETGTATMTGGGTPLSVMSASITLTSSSSKVLVLVDMNVGSSNGYNTSIYLYRAGTKVYFGDAATNRPSVSKTANIYGSAATTYMQIPVQIHYLDSPGVSPGTSVTYDVRIASYGSVGASFNRSWGDQNDPTNSQFDGRNASSVTLMEVSV